MRTGLRVGHVSTWLLIGALGLGLESATAQETASADRRAPSAQQTSEPAAVQARTSGFVRNWTRVEGWNYFEPRAGGGDPTYADIANRLQFGIQRTTAKYDIAAALQYVQFGGLPSGSAGPGPFGVGAAYFGHSGNTHSNQVYVRYLNVRFKALGPGVTVQLGRMGYTGGTESPSGNGKIEAVKNMRVASRIIGEFEWSIYQRGYDGVRADYDRPEVHATAIALLPTQGGFEDAAGLPMNDVELFGGSLSVKPDQMAPYTDAQFFVYRYNDRRDVRGRPDNSGLSAAQVDVKVNTFGATLVGTYPTASGTVDALLWIVGQSGSWYGQSHRAYAVAAEAGYQWNDVAWRPWLRGGLFKGSGDDDPGDDRHGTFFQMLPTVRKYSLSASYNLMNSTDIFAQVVLRPRPSLNLRFDVHRLGLTESADRWYFGSGATQNSGTIFGFGSRPSNGESSLGTVLEGSAGYTINSNWSINGYIGFIKGGGIVEQLFAGDRLTFAYFEQVVRF